MYGFAHLSFHWLRLNVVAYPPLNPCQLWNFIGWSQRLLLLLLHYSRFSELFSKNIRLGPALSIHFFHSPPSPLFTCIQEYSHPLMFHSKPLAKNFILVSKSQALRVWKLWILRGSSVAENIFTDFCWSCCCGAHFLKSIKSHLSCVTFPNSNFQKSSLLCIRVCRTTFCSVAKLQHVVCCTCLTLNWQICHQI